jgi:hypothetical protein
MASASTRYHECKLGKCRCTRGQHVSRTEMMGVSLAAATWLCMKSLMIASASGHTPAGHTGAWGFQHRYNPSLLYTPVTRPATHSLDTVLPMKGMVANDAQPRHSTSTSVRTHCSQHGPRQHHDGTTSRQHLMRDVKRSYILPCTATQAQLHASRCCVAIDRTPLLLWLVCPPPGQAGTH